MVSEFAAARSACQTACPELPADRQFVRLAPKAEAVGQVIAGIAQQQRLALVHRRGGEAAGGIFIPRDTPAPVVVARGGRRQVYFQFKRPRRGPVCSSRTM